MDQAAIALATAIVPGVGPVLKALDFARQLYANMKESQALCDSVQTRLDAAWAKLQAMEKAGTLPPKFRVADFTDIVAKFHALVAKQAQKSLVLRIGTSASFAAQLRVCHEELDQLQELLRDQATEDLLTWRRQWEQDVQQMMDHVTQLAATGVASRLQTAAESAETIAALVHEKDKLVDQEQIVEALQAICYQLARQSKQPLPSSMPPWFFTFDDVDVEPEPVHAPEPGATAMGTIHRAKWGAHTNVIVKKIELPPAHKPSPTGAWKEADVWWKLNHPNVVRMFGACHVTQPAFIVCEEARHGNIRKYLAADARRKRRFWRLQLDVAVGLEHLRASHVVHGNLKCNNILVGDDGRAKITDFGFSFIRNVDSAVKNDTLLTDDGESGAAVAPFIPSWPAPELRAAAERGDRLLPSYESDVYAFAVCMLQLLSNDGLSDDRFLARMAQKPKRPAGISDDAWDLIKRMFCQDPAMRPNIHQVRKRLQRLAEEEVVRHGAKHDFESSLESHSSSIDIDSERAGYEERRSGKAGISSGRQDAHPELKAQLQKELEALRQKIRDEERLLEKAMEKRQRAEAAPRGDSAQQPGENPKSPTLSPSLSTKQLLRILRWGTPEEQSQVLVAIDSNPKEHSAFEIVRNNGLDIIVASMKHGHSSEFRQTAIDILQSITIAGSWLYLDAVLEHGVTQILMSILHYRRVPAEQRRAGQFLVLLSTQSARARSFFVQNSGLELLIKLLWQEQIPMFDKRFKERTTSAIVDDMRHFLSTHAESRAKEGDRAMAQRTNHDLALQKYSEAIVLDPRNGRYYAKRSAVYSVFKKHDHAARDAKQCIRLLPQYGEGYFRHAIALFALKQPEQADRAIRHGRTHDPQYFNEERMYELAIHAPRGRERDNTSIWALGSVEF